MMNQACEPLGYAKVVLATTAAAGITSAIVTGTTTFVMPPGANLAVCVVEGSQPVRWRDDGTAPTPTSGMPMQVTVAPFEYSGDLAALQFIAQSVTATVDVSLYKTVG